MLRRIITEEIAAFMIFVIELASAEFYDKDRALAFKDLNEKKIWHEFIEKYEEKHILKPEALAEEMRIKLGREETPLLRAMLPNDKDTEFVIAIIRGISKKYNWNYSVSLDRFYSSRACRILSETKISLSSLSLEEMLELFDKERDPDWQTG